MTKFCVSLLIAWLAPAAAQACCTSMDAACQACTMGLTVEVYCSYVPDATGCNDDPTTLPTTDVTTTGGDTTLPTDAWDRTDECVPTIATSDIDVTGDTVGGDTNLIPTSGLEFSERTGMLYGYAWNRATSVEVFVQIEPTASRLSVLGVIPGIAYVNEQSAMNGDDYYSIMMDAAMTKKLVHVNLAQGFFVEVLDIDTTGVSGGAQVIPSAGLEYSSTTGMLYGYDWDSDTSEEIFLQLDPRSGKLTSLGAIPGIAYVNANSAMSGDDYYSIMLDASMTRKLVHVSLANGFRVTVSDFDTSGVNGGAQVIPSAGLEFSAATGMLVAYDWDSDTSEELLLQIDPVSKKLTSLGAIPGIAYVNANSALGEVPFLGTFYASIMMDTSMTKKLVTAIFPPSCAISPPEEAVQAPSSPPAPEEPECDHTCTEQPATCDQYLMMVAAGGCASMCSAEWVVFGANAFGFTGCTPSSVSPPPPAPSTLPPAVATTVTTTADFAVGWTWFSLNVELDDMSVGAILDATQLTLAQDDQVRNQRDFTMYYPGYGFFGGLGAMTTNEMYTIKVTQTGSLALTGTPVALPKAVTLSDGWTFLPMPYQTATSITNYMPAYDYQNGDHIKSQSQFSDFYTGYGWFGSLSQFEPGKGYKVKVTSGGTATFTEDRRQLEQVKLRHVTVPKRM